ncbi:hypothetical protein [Myroides sp. TSA_177.3]|uniref:hypothetical protein n=1 Tax=Myroides sp. TSA_177.3 TaxID=3415650 RepID=UPI004045FD4A
MKNLFVLLFCISGVLCGKAQTANASQQFIHNLAQHCGKAYKGTIVSTPVPADFDNKELIMYVSSCDKREVKIAFFVGDDLSRTWVFTSKGDRIELKHDHRQRNGKPDEVTMYGGTTTNSGTPHIQYFPADQETALDIPAAASNLWWVTIDEKEYSYNLQRAGSKTSFNVVFDITKPITTDKRAW